MDFAYHTIFSKVVLFQAVAILPLLLYTIPYPPEEVKAEFPPPDGFSGTERRVLSVPKHPSIVDLGFLLIIYLIDIVFLHPFTIEGRLFYEENGSTLVWWVFKAGSVALVVQFLAACSWSGVRTSWVSAERRHGLWHFTPWAIYYTSFILTGLGIGLPLFFKLGWLLISLIIEVSPVAWKIFSYQCTSLKVW